MIDQRRRTIPRVAAATLTFGGTALVSCGDDGSDIISEWCETKESCYGSAYYAPAVRSCMEYYRYEISYYGAMCAGAIGRALSCYLQNVDCNEVTVGDYSDCAEERDRIDAACVPPPPEPAPEGAVRDFCELLVECYGDYYEYYEYSVDECHQDYSNLIEEYVDGDGPLCGDALDGLLGCYSNLTCDELETATDFCNTESAQVETYCY